MGRSKGRDSGRGILDCEANSGEREKEVQTREGYITVLQREELVKEGCYI